MIYFQSLTKTELADLLLPHSRVKEERSLRDLSDGDEKTALLEKIEKKKKRQSESISIDPTKDSPFSKAFLKYFPECI